MQLEVPLGLFSLFVGGVWAAVNGWAIVERRRTKRFRSTVPVVGAGFLVGGLSLFPATRPIAWVGFFLDPGTWDLLWAVPRVCREAWSTSRFNLCEEYAGRDDRKTAHLRLYRGGAFILIQRIERKRDELGVRGAGTTGRWSRAGERLALESEEGLRVVLVPSGPGTLHLAEGGPGLRKNPEFSLEGMALKSRG